MPRRRRKKPKSRSEEKKIDPKEIIFEHLGDGYGWEVPFCHDVRIPLPVIVRDYQGDWHCFSSSRVGHGHSYTVTDSDGAEMTFRLGRPRQQVAQQARRDASRGSRRTDTDGGVPSPRLLHHQKRLRHIHRLPAGNVDGA